MSDPDPDLLRRFARDRAEDAFAELVKRHVNLVYSAALRQVRSPQLAEEVAQSVFSDLARNANKLCAPGSSLVLTAWLYQVTRHTAVDVVRKESRRQAREQIAAEMNAMNTAETRWTDIEPFLDEAVAALEETDRTAILMRYFENKPLREVGAQLGLSDDAAQKRVSRAVEKLREYFSKRKITVGVGGLIALISANAVQSAPIGLAVTISAAALAGSAVTTSTIVTATTKTIAMTAFQKTLVTATVAVLAGAGIYETRQVAQLRGQVQALQLQQAPLMNQVQQLQNDFADATNRLAGLLAENSRLRTSSNETELLKLRGEVTRLQNAANDTKSINDPVEVAAKNWLTKVNLLKQRLAQMPNAKIPELQFADEMDWLNAALGTSELKTDDDYLWDLHNLLSQVEDKFGKMGNKALEKYIQANNGQFPTDLSQLQPYFDSPVDDAILQRYEIVSARSIPKEREVAGNFDWLVVQKVHAFDNYKNEGREVFGANGYGNSWTFW